MSLLSMLVRSDTGWARWVASWLGLAGPFGLSLALVAGQQLFEAMPVSKSGRGAYEASLQAMDDELVVAWHDFRDGNAEIYVRELDADGEPLGEELRLTHSSALSFEADVERLANDIVVAWYDRPREGPLEARVGRWAQDGDMRWERRLSSPARNGRNPLVRVVGDSVFCAWLEEDGDESGVQVVWLDSDGQPSVAAREIARAGRTTWNLNAAVDGNGEVWVVFDAPASSGAHELFLARVPHDRTLGSQVLPLTPDDGVDSRYPDIAFADAGTPALTWFDERDGNREVYLAVPSGELWSHEALARDHVRVTVTPGESIGAYVTWNGGRIGVAWSDEVEGQHEIFFQAFDSSGQALDPARRVTRNSTASLIPAIEPWEDGFALAWNEDVVEARGTHETGGRSEVVFAFVR